MCKKKFKANSEKKEKVNTRVVKKNGLSSIGAKLLSKADFSTKTSKVDIDVMKLVVNGPQTKFNRT